MLLGKHAIDGIPKVLFRPGEQHKESEQIDGEQVQTIVEFVEFRRFERFRDEIADYRYFPNHFEWETAKNQ